MPSVEDAAHGVRLAGSRWPLDQVERHPLRLWPRHTSKVWMAQVRTRVLDRLELAEVVLAVQHSVVALGGHLTADGVKVNVECGAGRTGIAGDCQRGCHRRD